MLLPAEEPGQITILLQRWRDGDTLAENELFALILPKLRSLARYLMKGERKGHTLQASELVDQTYLKLVHAKDQNWRNRQHFFAIAGRVMRRHLIDHARARPKVEFVGLEGIRELIEPGSRQAELAIHVDRLLAKMAENHPDWCTVVELKFFLGFTDQQSAHAMGFTVRTLQRKWQDAREWLFDQMESEHAERRAG